MEKNPKILVIDDDQRSGKTIKTLLSSQGYEVCYASSGAMGIQKAFEYKPDLVLCDIKMEPIDGYHVFNALKNNSLINHAPFIFLSDSSKLEDIRSGMNMGADDFFVKPIHNEDLIRSIENRLGKFKVLKESGKREFKALFNLSPNGIFLFDHASIIDANQVMLNNLELNRDEIKKLRIEDIIDNTAAQRIKDKLQRCLSGNCKTFNERVTLRSKSGKITEVIIGISLYEDTSRFSRIIGLVSVCEGYSKPVDHGRRISEVTNILRKEKITIPDPEGKKLANAFYTQNVNKATQNYDLFSKRENQVLNLSLEGLPMKLIAHQLSISDRTVEKHRAKLMEKTGSKNIVEVIVYAIRNNIIAI